MNILGVRIDNFSQEDILVKIESFLREDSFHQIATVNPEFIVEAQENQDFKDILNRCALNVADGVGIAYAFMRYGKRLRCRMSGADLINEVLAIANKERLGVFLACSTAGLSSYAQIVSMLEKEYPHVVFGGENIDPKSPHLYKIQDTRYKILFCNFGAPVQEVFINSLSNGTIRLALGMGGSFDFLTGKIRRAPYVLRRIGLEWLWRLMLEPRYRFKRVWKAVVVFPIKILAAK